MDGNNDQVYKILLDIQKEVSETKQAVRDLTGPTGRVTKLEEEMERQENRQWFKAAVTTPLTLAIHYALRYMGVNL